MKLKAGIIGLGVGEQHIKGYQNSSCDVVALCDIADDKLAMARQKYAGIKVTEQANEILEDADIQIVSIASYDNHHYAQIVKAIENDKHIFVEKPLCLHEEEARHIRQLLNEKPHIKMSSNLILRKCPRFIELKKRIETGGMGDIYHVEGDYNYGRLEKVTNGWRGQIDFYSAVHGGGVHIIDLFLWLTEAEIEEVAGFGNNISSKGSQFKYNDMVTSVLKFKNGMTGKMSVNFGCVRPHYHGLSIYGTKATFENNTEFGKYFTSRDPYASYEKMSQHYPGVHKGDLIRDFVHSIVKNTDSEVSKEDIFKVMSVCFAIEKAVNEGPVKVEYI